MTHDAYQGSEIKRERARERGIERKEWVMCRGETGERKEVKES